jgi:protein gp37
MSANSGIEWTDHTFNPWIGCTKVSPACDNCYAERQDHRFGGGHWGAGAPRKRTKPGNWNEPRKWDRQAEAEGARYRVFCASLADVFDNEVPESWRNELWELIRATPNLDWLLLTKRIGNAADMLPPSMWSLGGWPNVWLGITVVTQEEADRDIPKLLETPAAVRFISAEPLLESLDVGNHLWPVMGEPTGFQRNPPGQSRPGLDWVIAGGESGPDARPMLPDWVRSLRDQCRDAGVPFLFKQWGEWAPVSGMPSVHGETDVSMERVGKKAAGRLLDGETWDQVPGREVAPA